MKTDKIQHRDNFVIDGELEVRECVGTDDGLVWYCEDDYSEAKSVDPGICTKVSGFIVKACNSYDIMLSTLKTLKAHGGLGFERHALIDEAIRQAEE